MKANEALPRVYSRDELPGYLDYCRNQYQQTILYLTPEQAGQMCSFPWGKLPYGALMLYVMRHVQEHAAQLNMVLDQNRR